MKKISRILTMVIVVGMIAAIPASTQVLPGSRGEISDDSNLPILILINRLELSEEQMNSLHDILSNLLEVKAEPEALLAEFEDVMIEFSGTGEELDALMATFREDQQVLAEALRESIQASLDQARDLLSINQGNVLREALPSLLGRDVSRTSGSIRSLPMGRADMMEQMQQLPRGALPQMQAPMMGSERMSGRGGSFDEIPDRFASDSMASRMQERFDGDSMPEMFEERFGDQVPEALREKMEDHFGGHFDNNADHQDIRNESAMPMQGVMGLRGRGQFGEDSFSTQRPQLVHDEQFGVHGDLFELLEQVIEVLELKLAAI